MLTKLLRDNVLINPVLRNVIKVIHKFVPLDRLTSLYRIYGTVKLNNGDLQFKVYCESDDHIANELFYNQGYEESEFKLIRTLTGRCKHFVDVGANTGIFSIYAASTNKELNIFSFEPHPGNFNRFLKNVSINKLTNIHAFQIALGATKANIELTVPADLSISTTASANSAYTKNFHRLQYTNISVQQKTLDEILIAIPLTPHDLIKIDVEYYELEVLKGMESTLKNNRPLILIEILQYENLINQFAEMRGKINANQANEVFSFLKSLDYYCYSISSNGLRSIASLKDQENRNFLFLPAKLPNIQYTLDEIEKALNELGPSIAPWKSK
jgi:FkbM family methyltransferase